jgi:membrane-associated phospholipid phosphatase
MYTTVRYKLKHGIAKDAMQNPFERATAFSYTFVAATSLIAVTVISASRFDFGVPIGAFAGLATFIACAILLRRYDHDRIAGTIEASSLFALISILGMIVSILLAGTAMPYTDELLIAADTLLGFNWPAANAYFRQDYRIVRTAAEIYLSLNWQPFLLFTALFATRRSEQAWRFLNAWIVALVMTLALFPFYPALAAFDYYGVAPVLSDPSRLGDRSAYMSVLGGARSGAAFLINDSSMVGLITFPSFHAAAGILLAYGFWPIVLLRYPFMLLNAAMVVSAIFVGGHYLIDIIGGLMVAAAAIKLTTTRVGSRSPPTF